MCEHIWLHITNGTSGYLHCLKCGTNYTPTSFEKEEERIFMKVKDNMFDDIKTRRIIRDIDIVVREQFNW